VARYELLRGRALAGDPGGWRCGLAVLQHRGVAAWLRAWQPVAVITTVTPARSTTAAFPAPGAADRLVEALASMALAALARR
jgi:hypothetical protein